MATSVIDQLFSNSNDLNRGVFDPFLGEYVSRNLEIGVIDKFDEPTNIDPSTTDVLVGVYDGELNFVAETRYEYNDGDNYEALNTTDPNENDTYRLEVGNDIAGFDLGSNPEYVLQYNFLQQRIPTKAQAGDVSLYVDGISGGGKEVSIRSTDTEVLDLIQTFEFDEEFQKPDSGPEQTIEPYDYVANFGDGVVVPMVNWSIIVEVTKTGAVKTTETGDIIFRQQAVLLFPVSVADVVEVGDELQIEKQAAKPYFDKFQVRRPAPVDFGNDLAGPDFSAAVDVSGNSDTFEAADALTSSGVFDVDLGIDYSEFSNFVHYSSAEERVFNFRYKIKKLRQIFNRIGSDVDFAIAKSEIKSVTESLGPYELWLLENWYPKSGDGSLVNPSDSVFESLIEEAKLYDAQNTVGLRRQLPDFVVEDEDNQDFVLFVDMVGHFFDRLRLLIKNVKNARSTTDDSFADFPRSMGGILLASLGGDASAGYPNINDAPELDYKLFEEPFELETGENLQEEVWSRLLSGYAHFKKGKGSRAAASEIAEQVGAPAPDLVTRQAPVSGLEKRTEEVEVSKLNPGSGTANGTAVVNGNGFVRFESVIESGSWSRVVNLQGPTDTNVWIKEGGTTIAVTDSSNTSYYDFPHHGPLVFYFDNGIKAASHDVQGNVVEERLKDNVSNYNNIRINVRTPTSSARVNSSTIGFVGICGGYGSSTSEDAVLRPSRVSEHIPAANGGNGLLRTVGSSQIQKRTWFSEPVFVGATTYSGGEGVEIADLSTKLVPKSDGQPAAQQTSRYRHTFLSPFTYKDWALEFDNKAWQTPAQEYLLRYPILEATARPKTADFNDYVRRADNLYRGFGDQISGSTDSPSKGVAKEPHPWERPRENRENPRPGQAQIINFNIDPKTVVGGRKGDVELVIANTGDFEVVGNAEIKTQQGTSMNMATTRLFGLNTNLQNMSTNIEATKNFRLEKLETKTITIEDVRIPSGGPVKLIADTNTDRAEINLAYYKIESITADPSSGTEGETDNVTVSGTIKNTGGSYGARRTIRRTAPNPTILAPNVRLSAGESTLYDTRFDYTWTRSNFDAEIDTENEKDSATLSGEELGPANFQIQSLSISPSSVEVDANTSVDVDATIKNTGESDDTQDLKITLDNSPNNYFWPEGENFSLNSGQTKSIPTFELSTTSRDNTSGSVPVRLDTDNDSQTASLTITAPDEPDPAEFNITVGSGAVVATSGNNSGTTSIDVTAENVGASQGSINVDLKINGSTVGSTSFSLGAGSSNTKSVSVPYGSLGADLYDVVPSGSGGIVNSTTDGELEVSPEAKLNSFVSTGPNSIDYSWEANFYPDSGNQDQYGVEIQYGKGNFSNSETIISSIGASSNGGTNSGSATLTGLDSTTDYQARVVVIGGSKGDAFSLTRAASTGEINKSIEITTPVNGTFAGLYQGINDFALSNDVVVTNNGYDSNYDLAFQWFDETDGATGTWKDLPNTSRRAMNFTTTTYDSTDGNEVKYRTIDDSFTFSESNIDEYRKGTSSSYSRTYRLRFAAIDSGGNVVDTAGIKGGIDLNTELPFVTDLTISVDVRTGVVTKVQARVDCKELVSKLPGDIGNWFVITSFDDGSDTIFGPVTPLIFETDSNGRYKDLLEEGSNVYNQSTSGTYRAELRYSSPSTSGSSILIDDDSLGVPIREDGT